jgi:hypothetical protein
MKKTIEITFKNMADFRRRIAVLWQDQKDDEIYNFTFLCPEAEKEFDELSSCFQDMIEN